MSRPLNLHLLLILTTTLQCSCTHVAAAEENESTCSDISAHQQVLDEGMKFYNENGGVEKSFAGLADPAESVTLIRDHHPEHKQQQPFRSNYHVFTPTTTKPLFDLSPHKLDPITENDFQEPKEPEPDVKTIRIASESDLSSAEIYAQGREIAGDYTAAKSLYEKILAFRRAQPQMPFDSTAKDIERVELFRSAHAYSKDREFTSVATDCKLILDNIDVAQNINLETKLALTKTVFTFFNDDKSTAMRRAQHCCDDYQKELQCLNMAEDLNTAAFKLEKVGMYTMAEKMYRESLAIKEKNLGPNAPDTLAQFGELARLEAEQGHVANATELYEGALASFRKIPSKGTGFSTLLQNYGDMLAHAQQKDKAEKIYSEARAFFAAVGSDPANGKIAN